MERNLTKCVHVEFYGLPGSGKSTISHMLAEELRAKGFDVSEPSFNSDHVLNPVVRKIFKLYKTVLFSLRYPQLVQKTYSLLSQRKRIELRWVFKQILNIAPKITCYLDSQSKVYIWDEGLVQSSISATLDNHTNTDVVANELISISGDRKIIKVYIKIDIDTALKRLEGRVKHDSRVEKEHDVLKKVDLMNQFNASCESIKGERIVINNTVSSDYIYNYIIKAINY